MLGYVTTVPTLPDPERAASEAALGVSRPAPASSLPREPQVPFLLGHGPLHLQGCFLGRLRAQKEVLQLLHPNFTEPHQMYLIPEEVFHFWGHFWAKLPANAENPNQNQRSLFGTKQAQCRQQVGWLTFIQHYKQLALSANERLLNGWGFSANVQISMLPEPVASRSNLFMTFLEQAPSSSVCSVLWCLTDGSVLRKSSPKAMLWAAQTHFSAFRWKSALCPCSLRLIFPQSLTCESHRCSALLNLSAEWTVQK